MPAVFPEAALDFGKQGNQSAVAELRMGMTELEASPLWIAIGSPAFLVAGQRQNIPPSDRLLFPAKRLDRLPHGDDHRGEDKVVGGSLAPSRRRAATSHVVEREDPIRPTAVRRSFKVFLLAHVLIVETEILGWRNVPFFSRNSWKYASAVFEDQKR
jgi:hypothetical protein